jgi:hypothetical protein
VSRLRLLILGGYGTFGGRLARLLSDESDIELIIAGRDLAKAQRFAAELDGAAKRTPIAFDRDGDVEARLNEIKPDVVVDAAGPFQAYRDPYRIVRACIALPCHYMDLADGAEFVQGIAVHDDAARAAGVFVLSGVSSFPVLSAAAVRELSAGLSHIATVSGGIAPSPYAGIGANVVRAIASYAGRDVPLVRDGKSATGKGLCETRRYTIAPPGALPLRSRLFALIDVPDLLLLPKIWPELRSVWLGVGPVPESLFRGLIALAYLVRVRALGSLVPFARLFHRAINGIRWGEHRGGMFVEIEGRTPEGLSVRRSWHLIAEGDDGPFIPSMAIEVIVRRLISGNAPAKGARAAALELDLADYAASFRRKAIVTGIREENTSPFLYQRVMGDAWNRLPEAIRILHSGVAKASGMAEVKRGGGLLARIVGAVIGFPKAGAEIPVTVDFEFAGGAEIWTRTFGSSRFSSVQTEGQGRLVHMVRERFGIVDVSLAVVLDSDILRLVVRDWRVLGIPMPLWLAPGGDAFEHAEGGRFHFNVEIAHPLTGLIVRYRGWLVPA